MKKKIVSIALIFTFHFSCVSVQAVTFEEPPTVPDMRKLNMSDKLIATVEFETMQDAKSGAIGHNFRFLPERYFTVRSDGASPSNKSVVCRTDSSGKSTGICVSAGFIEMSLSRNKDKM